LCDRIVAYVVDPEVAMMEGEFALNENAKEKVNHFRLINVFKVKTSDHGPMRELKTCTRTT
jgi:hypothetical protein